MSASADTRSPIIVVDGVHKSFDRRFVRGGFTTFKTQLVQRLRGGHQEKVQRQKLQVLRGLSFDVAAGETVGIVGQNGAGKSTLLKLLTGIYKPSLGSVSVKGRVSALLELGAGFHPEYSGRENIFMNGMILGLTRREIQEKEDEIIEFSELGDFIDAPVRTYSSGMYMRLAFSVAVNVKPDVLIIDEILAVGDEHFQRKSKAKLDEFKDKNMAIVLVTHSLGAVETWCTRAIWLEAGVIAAEGDPAVVVHRYREAVRVRDEQAMRAEQQSHAVLREIKVLDRNGARLDTAQGGDDFTVHIDTAGMPGDAKAIVINVFDRSGQVLLQSRFAIDASPRERPYLCRFSAVPLHGVEARIAVSVQGADGAVLDAVSDAARLSFLPTAGIGVVGVASSWS
jgi:ABC-type polysaccharide/polyol phosphate transport system ATPase subunit